MITFHLNSEHLHLHWFKLLFLCSSMVLISNLNNSYFYGIDTTTNYKTPILYINNDNVLP